MERGPYEQMRSWLLPIVIASACTGTPKTYTTPTGDTALVTAEGTACVEVALDTELCPEASTLTPSDLTGDCGSIIASIDGEGTFGSSPTGEGDSSVSWCCYPVHQTAATCDYGRPYVSEERALVSTVETGTSWCAPAPQPAAIPEEARIALQIAWEKAALDEHAAVAAFSRIALELLAFGAPADLVDDTLRAAREEVVHARLGFSLASRYAGLPRTPGAFPLEAHVPRATDLARFAAATAREGCVGETVTALMAAECLARATDPHVARVLAQIVADENGHAQLAWRVRPVSASTTAIPPAVCSATMP